MNKYKEYSHQFWMNEAIQLLKTENTNEVPIAALIVKDNVLISKAVNKIEKFQDSTAHAEMLVIKEASNKLQSWRLNGCIIYTTLEPCAMCTGAIINSRIEKIVFGAHDLEQGTCGSKTNLPYDLEKNKLEIIGGILEVECVNLLKDFFKSKRA